MSCEYAGQLARPDAPDEGPTSVWVCRSCPGGVLVTDPHHHDQAVHRAPAPSTATALPSEIPTPRPAPRTPIRKG